MALIEYTPERRDIKAREGQVLGQVQGLSLEHVAVLVREHLPDLEALFELFQTGDVESLEAQDWLKLAMPIITQAPGLAANMIALAADEPGSAQKVQTWPLGVQLMALVDIFDLTVAEVGSVKKAMEMVAALLAMKNNKAAKTR
jgi:hypothetical protein